MTNLYAKRNISDLENRLRLLLCLDQLGMVTREQLWPFVAHLDLMEYVPMCLYLDQLLKDEFVSEGQGLIKGTLFLTQAGFHQLKLLANRIAMSDKQRITKEAPLYLDGLREKLTARAVYENIDNGYGAKCMITEGDFPSLICLVKDTDREFVEKVVHDFRINAPRITLYLLSYCLKSDQPAENVFLFTGEDSEKALREAKPGTPTLCQLGKNTFAAAVAFEKNDSELRFSLQMNSQLSALCWIQAMEQSNFDHLHMMMIGLEQ